MTASCPSWRGLPKLLFWLRPQLRAPGTPRVDTGLWAVSLQSDGLSEAPALGAHSPLSPAATRLVDSTSPCYCSSWVLGGRRHASCLTHNLPWVPARCRMGVTQGRCPQWDTGAYKYPGSSLCSSGVVGGEPSSWGTVRSWGSPCRHVSTARLTALARPGPACLEHPAPARGPSAKR